MPPQTAACAWQKNDYVWSQLNSEVTSAVSGLRRFEWHYKARWNMRELWSASNSGKLAHGRPDPLWFAKLSLNGRSCERAFEFVWAEEHAQKHERKHKHWTAPGIARQIRRLEFITHRRALVNTTGKWKQSLVRFHLTPPAPQDEILYHDMSRFVRSCRVGGRN